LETGDVDQDGRGEVIIGDYDNNLYVFEHLTNNTYKRAFRSQDITHSELSTTSPYAWDLLEGVSGTFYRTIWDHIEELVVGLDMDNDGFKEMVATAGLSIFVWEQRNNGFVSVDDEYDLIWHADLRHSAWAELFADLEISGISGSSTVLGQIQNANGPKVMQIAVGATVYDLVELTKGFTVSARMPWPELFHLGAVRDCDTKIVLADFDINGSVNFEDFAVLVGYWLQDESFVDIAPPPHGDYLVDTQDLAVLAESWLRKCE